MTPKRLLIFVFTHTSIIWTGLVAHPQSKSKPAIVQSKSAIVQDVELVQIPVIIFDNKGAVATDLDKSNFRILEDGVEQKILYCEREREPVSFVIAADVSQSMT